MARDQKVRFGAIAVSVVRYRDEIPEFLLLKRAKGVFAGYWIQITGKIEEGETGWQAAVREIEEESGLVVSDLYSADYCDHFYNAALDCIEVLPLFIAQVSAEQKVTLNSEHTDFTWVPMEEAIQRIPFLGHKAALRANELALRRQDFPPWALVWSSTGGKAQ